LPARTEGGDRTGAFSLCYKDDGERRDKDGGRQGADCRVGSGLNSK